MLVKYVWIIVATLSVIIEAATAGLATIWFAIGAVIAWIVQLLGFSQTTQIVVFLLSSTALLVITRPFVKKYLKIGSIRTNADKNIGEKGIVIETIDNINNKGQVRIGGQIWSAKSVDGSIIEKDTIVIIEEIKGVKLFVSRKTES